MSRRDVLRAGVMLGAGLAAGACVPPRREEARPSATTASDGPRIVVVGAGLAGLTAAYRLTQAGVPVRCFEARDRVGGRCFSSRDWSDGQVAEHGGEFIDTRHVHLRGLADELGLGLDDLWDAWIDGSAWPYLVDGKATDEAVWLEAEKPVVDAVMAAGRRIGVVGDAGISSDAYTYGTATPEGRALDAMSMAEWLDDELPGVSGSSLGRVLEARFAGWYGSGMDRLSAALWLDYYVLPDDGADERYTIHGGNDQLPAIMAERLPEGSLSLGRPLTAMRRTRDRGYELTFAGSSEPVSADIVVMTVPFTALREVDLDDAGFSPQRLDAIRAQAMGENTKLILQFDGHPDTWRVGDRPWSGGMEHVDGLLRLLGELGHRRRPGEPDHRLLRRIGRGAVHIERGPRGGTSGDGRRHPGGDGAGRAGSVGRSWRPGVARRLAGGSVDEGFVRGVRARPDELAVGLHAAPRRRCALRGRAHVDVQPGLPQRRGRERPARRHRGDDQARSRGAR